jgi:2,4-diketo-3-deoxy-L-fuconate hydrolase
MHICRFNQDRLGIVEGQSVYDVTGALEFLSSPKWPGPLGDPLVLNLGPILERAAQLRKNAIPKPLPDVSLYSPITRPTKIMAAPANYRLHVQIDAQDPGVHHGLHNKMLEGVERPVEKLGLFLKASSSIAGPADGVSLRWLDRRNDHEVELVVIIGRQGKNISAARAFDHIAGYMIGLDMTVRGTEDRSYRKSADSYAVLGPWLTTADEIQAPEKLMLWLEVSGVERQRSSTAAMTVGIAELIQLASSVYTLHPGDVLFTGTPEGVGPVNPGDRIRAGCEGIGEMTLEVRAAK